MTSIKVDDIDKTKAGKQMLANMQRLLVLKGYRIDPEDEKKRPERLATLCLQPEGLDYSSGDCVIHMCYKCSDHLNKKKPKKPPMFALANGLWTGQLPEILRRRENQLRWAEMLLISPFVVYTKIIKLMSAGRKLNLGNRKLSKEERRFLQSALTGHSITFPTDHINIHTRLPRRASDVAGELMKVLFAARDAPTLDDVKSIVSVRPRVLMLWLSHLAKDHPFWQKENIEIDMDALNALPKETDEEPDPVPKEFQDIIIHVTAKHERRRAKVPGSKWAEDSDSDDEVLPEGDEAPERAGSAEPAQQPAAAESDIKQSAADRAPAAPVVVEQPVAMDVDKPAQAVEDADRAPRAIPLHGPPPASPPPLPPLVRPFSHDVAERYPPPLPPLVCPFSQDVVDFTDSSNPPVAQQSQRELTEGDRESTEADFDIQPALHGSAMVDQLGNKHPTSSVGSVLMPKDVTGQKEDLKASNPFIEVDERCDILVSIRGSEPTDTRRDTYWWTVAFFDLFYWGAGGPASERPKHLSIERWAEWAMQVHDDRFAKHPTFMAVLFSVIRRYRAWRVAYGRAQLKDWTDMEVAIGSLSEAQMRAYIVKRAREDEERRRARFNAKQQKPPDEAAEKLQKLAHKLDSKQQDQPKQQPPPAAEPVPAPVGPGAAALEVRRGTIQEAVDHMKRAYDLIDKVLNTGKSVSSKLPGSDALRVVLRRHLNGMHIEFGLPFFFITITPGEIYHRLWCSFAGLEVDLNIPNDGKMPPKKLRNLTLALNPAAQSRFFHRFYELFLKYFVGFDPNAPRKEYYEGVFGFIVAFLTMIELQERGSPHGHGLFTPYVQLLPDQWLSSPPTPHSAFKLVSSNSSMRLRASLTNPT